MNGDFVRALIAEGAVTAVHDVSDGGLLVAVAEMAMASGRGAELDAAPPGATAHGFWFGEDQARYLVTVPAGRAIDAVARAGRAGIAAARIGRVHGTAIALSGERPILVKALAERFEGWLPTYMAGGAA